MRLFKFFVFVKALTLTSFLSAESGPLSKKIYDDLIQPIFNAKCLECHGTNKSKGKLKLNTKKDFLTGGSGAGKDIVIKGNVKDSELIFRITLPKDDEEAMPPMEDKDHYNPVTDDELKVIKAWIKLGASFDLLVSELNQETQKSALHVFKNMPQKLVSKTLALQPKLPVVPPVNPSVLENLGKEGILAMPIAQNTNAIYVNASYAGKNFNDQKINLLDPISSQVLWLNLARTNISNKAIESLTKHRLLTRLHLENTSITDEASIYLSKLKNLEYLNLYGTQISDSSIPHLKKLTKLKKIFLWQTKVTSSGAEMLKKSFVNGKVYSSLLSQKKDFQKIIKNKTQSENLKIKKLEDLVKSENLKTKDLKPINTNCPVTNKLIEKGKIEVFEGRKIGFCCDKCITKFALDGAVYRSKIKGFKASESYITAEKNWGKAQSLMEQSIEEVQQKLRLVSQKLKNLGPEINLGWEDPVANK